MNRTLIVGVLFLAGLKLPAQCVKDYTPRSADEVEIVRLENEWCDAAVMRDAICLNRSSEPASTLVTYPCAPVFRASLTM